jgi:ABC-2 type transport system permease protein
MSSLCHATPRGTARRVRKYVAVFVISLRQRRRESSLLFARAAFMVLVIMVFSRLWQAVLPTQPGGGLRAADCVWYLLITELVMLSQPRISLDIERDVRSGELAYHLTRPASYLGFKLAEGLAELSLAWLVLLTIGAPAAYLLAGALPHDPRSLLLAFPLAMLASLLSLLCNAVIGSSAFWIVDCTPVQWIWQKTSFVLGGLFVPLAFYPAWLRSIALVTPFAALLHSPGSTVFRFDAGAAVRAALMQLVWIGLAATLLSTLHRRGLRTVNIHGG